MEVIAHGRLRHQFFGEYSAIIALEFRCVPDAELALPKLGEGWYEGKHANFLVWDGSAEELSKCKEVLGSFGADVDAIDSLRYSVDYGEKFTVRIPVTVENVNQLELPIG